MECPKNSTTLMRPEERGKVVALESPDQGVRSEVGPMATARAQVFAQSVKVTLGTVCKQVI